MQRFPQVEDSKKQEMVNGICADVGLPSDRNDLETLLRNSMDSLFDGVARALPRLENATSNAIDALGRSLRQRIVQAKLHPSGAILVLIRFSRTMATLVLKEAGHVSGREILAKMDLAVDEEIKKILEDLDEGSFADLLQTHAGKRGLKDRKGPVPRHMSQESRGWIDVGGTRMCLLDIPGGWLGIRRAIVLFAGEDTSRRVFFEAGQAETFSSTALAKGTLAQTAEGFRDALDTFSEAGFGSFVVEELAFADGFARISCQDTFEAWATLLNGRGPRPPVCHYSTGVLLSFMQHLSDKHDLYAVETRCMAKGDEQCEFVLGTKEHLRGQGISLPRWGMTIKEKAKYLENLLENNRKVGTELKRKNTELSSLNKIAAAVNQSLDLNEICRLAIRELRRIVRNKSIVIYLLDETRQELSVIAQTGFSDSFLETVRLLSVGQGLTGSVALARTAMAYDNYAEFPQATEAALRHEKVRSLLSVPLMSKKTIVGVLTIASKTPCHFSREEMNLMTNIGNQLGVAIENARLHEEIKKSESKYRTLVEDIKDGYFVCQDDVVVLVNDAFLSMFGYNRDDVLGRDFRMFVGKDSLRRLDRVLKAPSPMTGLPEYLEFARKHQNGLELPTEVKMSVSEIDGKPAVIGILRDISERKGMEQRIRENERLASIGALTSAIAHEIKNPLSAIKMNIQILARSRRVHAADREHLEIAETEIKRLDGVLREMLHFVRPINMKAVYHSVSGIIDECVHLLNEKMKDSNICVRWSKSAELPDILVDSEKLKEAFLNIFLNAIAAMPRGGTIAMVTDRAKTSGKEVITVEIKDDGIGIARENIGKIFDPFFSTKSEGVGLGLSNVRKIVDAHGGTIEVQSAIDRGTSFKILLPFRSEVS